MEKFLKKFREIPWKMSGVVFGVISEQIENNLKGGFIRWNPTRIHEETQERFLEIITEEIPIEFIENSSVESDFKPIVFKCFENFLDKIPEEVV